MLLLNQTSFQEGTNRCNIAHFDLNKGEQSAQTYDMVCLQQMTPKTIGFLWKAAKKIPVP